MVILLSCGTSQHLAKIILRSAITQQQSDIVRARAICEVHVGAMIILVSSTLLNSVYEVANLLPVELIHEIITINYVGYSHGYTRQQIARWCEFNEFLKTNEKPAHPVYSMIYFNSVDQDIRDLLTENSAGVAFNFWSISDDLMAIITLTFSFNETSLFEIPDAPKLSDLMVPDSLLPYIDFQGCV